MTFYRALAACALLALCACENASGAATPNAAAENALASAPEVVSSHGIASFALSAAIDPSDNLPTFIYRGDYDVTPTIRVKPGDTIDVELSNELAPAPHMAGDVNLHFHGLGSSPLRPQDDVLTMLAKPFRALHYDVVVPPDQPPGLYWYHTHVHGETNYQVGEGGMSGAIVVDGIASHVPALASMPEHIMVVRELGTGAGDAVPAARRNATPVCAPDPTNAVITIDRVLRPSIHVESGRPQFFRVINATGHRTLALAIDGAPLHVVAVDGFPLDDSPGHPAVTVESQAIVPPAGRVEFFASVTKDAKFRTLCFNSGPTGDYDPEQVLATLHVAHGAQPAGEEQSRAPIVSAAIADSPLPPPLRTRTVTLSEDANGFYINGKAYMMGDPPVFTVRTGTVERWDVRNVTSEVHDFHIHQVHFLMVAVNGKPVAHPIWQDSAVVPWRSTVTYLMDFRSPLIRGEFLFHCHILDHEDRGMMAAIRAI